MRTKGWVWHRQGGYLRRSRGVEGGGGGGGGSRGGSMHTRRPQGREGEKNGGEGGQVVRRLNLRDY